MKKSLFTLTFLCLLAFALQGQTIRRVNDNIAITGVNIYSTIQAAHDAAVAGDIIVIEPTNNVNAYGSLIATKLIHLVGNGYFLNKNPNTPFDQREPYITQITFNKGSANTTMTGIRVASSMAINCNNITISRCRLGGSISLGSNGSSPTTYGSYVNINRCFWEGGVNGQTSTPAGRYCTFTNNLMVGASSQTIVSSLENSTFSYNTYIPTSYGQYYGQIGNTINCVFSNNIFDWRNYAGTQQIIYGSETSTFSHNIVVGISALPTGIGNQDNITPATNLYTNTNPMATYSNLGESVFQLGSGSPVIGFGIGGTNPGAFGGSSPYILSGLAPNPIITNFTTSGVGNSTVPLSISTTVRGNN